MWWNYSCLQLIASSFHFVLWQNKRQLSQTETYEVLLKTWTRKCVPAEHPCGDFTELGRTFSPHYFLTLPSQQNREKNWRKKGSWVEIRTVRSVCCVGPQRQMVVEWWKGLTFLPLSHYILMSFNRGQQRGSLTRWHLSCRCWWSKGVSLNSSVWKKWHPLSFINSWWKFVEIRQWVLTQWGSEWCAPAVVRAIWQAILWTAMHSSYTTKWRTSRFASMQISGLHLQNGVQSWILVSVGWKQWQQCWIITKFVSDGSCKCLHRNRKKKRMQIGRNYWTDTRLKVTVSWIIILSVTRHSVTSTSRMKNDSLQSDNMWISKQRKSSRLRP